VAKLLVSVRSADEARAALEGGAAVIDIKEPDRGPLGRADVKVWQSVRQAVAGVVPVSVALGELREWTAGRLDLSVFSGLAFRKLGLSGAGRDWVQRWSALRDAWGPGPAWVAVVYADWREAGAPHPDAILDAALAVDDCAGVLIDTWNKAQPSPVDQSWASWVARARGRGGVVALAGGLGEAEILRLGPLAPDLFAVRGAACQRGDRRGPIDPDRVARLVRAAGFASASG
jgi:uncharacterized protein (UPF0264 family)